MQLPVTSYKKQAVIGFYSLETVLVTFQQSLPSMGKQQAGQLARWNFSQNASRQLLSKRRTAGSTSMGTCPFDGTS